MKAGWQDGMTDKGAVQTGYSDERVAIEANALRFQTEERLQALAKEMEDRGIKVDPLTGRVIVWATPPSAD